MTSNKQPVVLVEDTGTSTLSFVSNPSGRTSGMTYNSKIDLSKFHPKIQKLFKGKEHKLRMLGNYVIGETLGMGGYSKVKLGLHKDTGAKAALKIMFADQKSGKISDSKKKQLLRELNVMKKVSHPNVIQLYSYDANAEYPEADGRKTPCIMSALEFAAGGELFDYLMYTGHFDSRATRTYFGQLIAGLSAMHEAGIAHRDLKPENLLMDSKFTLKIADFGFATEFLDEDGNPIMLQTPCGTKNYLAPEFWKGQKYSYKCDIFACGIILFTVYAGFPPFMEAQPKDWWWDKYMYAVKYREKADTMHNSNPQKNKFYAESVRRMKLFWKAHTKKREFDDEDFKDLALTLIHPSPRKRYELKQIQNHPWMKKGDIYSQNELRQYVGQRVRTVLQQRAHKIRNMMTTNNVKQVQYNVRALTDTAPLTALEKRALFLDPNGDFLKNIMVINEDVMSAFQFFTYVPPAEMAARLERVVNKLGGGKCYVNPQDNEITIEMTLRYDKPQINAHFEDSSDKCVMTVRQYLVEDKYHPSVAAVVPLKAVKEQPIIEYVDDVDVDVEDDDEYEEDDNKSNFNNGGQLKQRSNSELKNNPYLTIAHDQRWLISFKRLRGQHGTYCSLVEKIIFSESVAAALTWEEILEATAKLSKVDSEHAMNDTVYELHDWVEESTNVKQTLEETADDMSTNTAIVSVADAHFKEYVYGQ